MQRFLTEMFPRHFENTFLSVFSNKSCTPTLRREMHHAFGGLYFDKMQPITLPTPKGYFQLSFSY